MKKNKKILFIILSCYISYYIAYMALSNASLDETTNSYICTIFLILPIGIYFIVNSFLNIRIKKENDTISGKSEKINRIKDLYNKYNFNQLSKYKHMIFEREYSRKGFDRVRVKNILFYYFDNNIDEILKDVEKAYENKKQYDNFLKELIKIKIDTPDNIIAASGYQREKFIKIENRIINNYIGDKKLYDITLDLKIRYINTRNQVNLLKEKKFTHDELFKMYEEWNDGNKNKENIRFERSVMSDSIRYNVFQRDNFTCQVCGATAKDGAKLHVDHIIPVSAGGKTLMSNLQTLCERCNLGKSNKTDSDFEHNMICPVCGSKLIEKKGRYGDFIGCSHYPKCKYIKK